MAKLTEHRTPARGKKAKRPGTGKPMSAEHKEKLRLGRERWKAARQAEEQAAIDSAPAEPQDEPAPPGEAGEGEAQADAPPPPPPRPQAPEPPPRVHATRKAAAGGDWRDKYRAAAGAGDDREATCVLAATMGVVLPAKRLSRFIESTGATPVFDDSFIDGAIRNCAVLTIDKYMPADLALTSELELAALMGTHVGQAFVIWLRRRKPGTAAKPAAPLRTIPFEAAPPPAPPRPTEANTAEPLVERPPVPGPFIPKATDVF